MKNIYTGVFFDSSELDKLFMTYFGKEKLSNVIENPHVVFTYKPGMVDPKLLGVPVKFKVVGYANDGKNQGLQVAEPIISVNNSISTYNSLLTEYYAVGNHHITVSISEDGKAIDTGKLRFEPISTPFEIVGKYGVFTDEGVFFEEPNVVTVYDFCRHKTQATELCALCDGGWVAGTVWIDYEDMFRIPDSLKDKIVKSDHWGELSIVNEHGEHIKIPVHFIDT